MEKNARETRNGLDKRSISVQMLVKDREGGSQLHDKLSHTSGTRSPENRNRIYALNPSYEGGTTLIPTRSRISHGK
jgi:hypothetical protein